MKATTKKSILRPCSCASLHGFLAVPRANDSGQRDPIARLVGFQADALFRILLGMMCPGIPRWQRMPDGTKQKVPCPRFGLVVIQSLEALAAEYGVHVQSVRKWMKTLEQHGLVRIVQRKRAGRDVPWVYQLHALEDYQPVWKRKLPVIPKPPDTVPDTVSETVPEGDGITGNPDLPVKESLMPVEKSPATDPMPVEKSPEAQSNALETKPLASSQNSDGEALRTQRTRPTPGTGALSAHNEAGDPHRALVPCASFQDLWEHFGRKAPDLSAVERGAAISAAQKDPAAYGIQLVGEFARLLEARRARSESGQPARAFQTQASR